MTITPQVNRFLDKTFKTATAQRLAVAVSGGIDSMCLTLLLQAWCKERGFELLALTVDHHLRPDSTAEAERVHQWLREQEIQHEILNWHPDPLTTRIQESAREARYQLLVNRCQDLQIGYLALAHTLDDQYETMLLRLAHHTGPLGLSGMACQREMNKVKILRPMLNIIKDDIRKEMLLRQAPWVEDPSNEKRAYTRVRIRQDRARYEEYHLTLERLNILQQRMAHYREEIEQQALMWLGEFAQFLPCDYVALHYHAFIKLDVEIQQLILSRLLSYISGHGYGPRNDLIMATLDRIQSPQFSAYSSHGCYLQKRRHLLAISREERAIPRVTPMNHTNLIWDSRYRIETNFLLKDQNFSVRPLGSSWLSFKDHPKMKELPVAIRRVLPSIWQKEQLILVPYIDYDGSPDQNVTCELTYLPALDLCRSRFIID